MQLQKLPCSTEYFRLAQAALQSNYHDITLARLRGAMRPTHEWNTKLTVGDEPQICIGICNSVFQYLLFSNETGTNSNSRLDPRRLVMHSVIGRIGLEAKEFSIFLDSFQRRINVYGGANRPR